MHASLEASIAQLREHLASTDDFTITWDYFLDHLGTRDAFFRLGRPRASPVLDDALGRVLSDVLRRRARVTGGRSWYVHRFQLWHGVVFVGGVMVCFLYDELSARGLCVFPHGAEGRTSLVRFTKVELPDGAILGAKASA